MSRNPTVKRGQTWWLSGIVEGVHVHDSRLFLVLERGDLHSRIVNLETGLALEADTGLMEDEGHGRWTINTQPEEAS